MQTFYELTRKKNIYIFYIKVYSFSFFPKILYPFEEVEVGKLDAVRGGSILLASALCAVV